MKIKHYYFFEETQSKMSGRKINAQNWDILRCDNNKSPFAIEKTIEEYEENCRISFEYEKAATILCKLISSFGNNTMVSLGCGKGILEWHIKKKLPDLYIECTDYAEKSVKLLRSVFTECNNISVFDMINGDYKKWKGATVLIYRVSTEFTSKEWKVIFNKMYEAGIENVIFVPTELLTFRIIYGEKLRMFMNFLKGNPTTFCGWMYSKSEFLKMFRGNSNCNWTVDLLHEGIDIFVLKKL